MTWPIIFPGLVGGINWEYASLDIGLGSYPGFFNWAAGGRLRPVGYWGEDVAIHAVYLGTQSQFSVLPHGAPFLWYQSIEVGYEVITRSGFSALFGGGVHVHFRDGDFTRDPPLVTPLLRLGLGWSFVDR